MNFEILKFLLKTQDSKHFEISFENFKKMPFGNIYSELFSDLENSKIKLRKS
jgi:hypothetical protein